MLQKRLKCFISPVNSLEVIYRPHDPLLTAIQPFDYLLTSMHGRIDLWGSTLTTLKTTALTKHHQHHKVKDENLRFTLARLHIAMQHALSISMFTTSHSTYARRKKSILSSSVKLQSAPSNRPCPESKKKIIVSYSILTKAKDLYT